MYSVGSSAVAGPQPCYPSGNSTASGGSDRVLKRLRGEGLHHLRARLPCGLVLQLERRELRDHELLSLLHLHVGDGPQGGEDTLHVLVLSCVDSAIFFVRSPPVIARAPAFIALMATMVSEASAKGLEATL